MVSVGGAVGATADLFLGPVVELIEIQQAAKLLRAKASG